MVVSLKYTSFIKDSRFTVQPRSQKKGYFFRFNGKENNKEIYGDGNTMDFGARIYDSRLGRWMSVDPLYMLYPFSSPYNFSLNSPIFFMDFDGREIYPTNQFKDSKYSKVFCKILTNIEAMPHAKKYLIPFLSPDKVVILRYHNTLEYNSDNIFAVTNNIGASYIMANKWDINLPKSDKNYSITFNSAKMFEISTEQPSGGGGIWGQNLSEVAIFINILHEFQHANGVHHNEMATNAIYRDDMKNALKEYFGENRFTPEQLEALSWFGLQNTDKFIEIFGGPESESYKKWYATISAITNEGCSIMNSNETLIDRKNEKPSNAVCPEICGN
jgi:RHS repeat-associated protein